ncbi:MAG: polyprenol monophosphomannose synthase [Ardenticatenia bacterium]|nr:MAG: polyprenol monophosphomannose synthase [Ardenticatenia bacterium]
MQTAIIIPTYNERENVPQLVEEIARLALGADVIIVDDNSPDGTGAVADALRETYGWVHVLHRAGKLGLGTAYKDGMRYALARGAERIITMDADFSHHPRYLPDMLAASERYDVVIGSRYVPGGGTANWPLSRVLLSWTANMVARLVLGLQAHDCTAGFRCYRRHVLTALDLERIRSNGYSFLVEMLFYCQQAGWRIGEVPILFEDRRQGVSKISRQEIYKAALTVFRLRLAGGAGK